MEFLHGLCCFGLIHLYITSVIFADDTSVYDFQDHKGIIYLNATTNGRPIQPEASFNITCRAVAKLSWYLNNAVLDLLHEHPPTSYQYDIIEEDLTDVIHNHNHNTTDLAYQSTLLVSQASKAHEGTYQCVVYATDNTTHKTEKYVEEISITLAEILVFAGPNITPSKLPSTVTLTCRVQANVPVEITWAFHHQYLVNGSERHVIFQDGTVWSNLTIIHADEDDLGRYACMARRSDVETNLVHPFASLGFVYLGNASDFDDDDLDEYDEDNSYVVQQHRANLVFDADTAQSAVPRLNCPTAQSFSIVRANANFPRETSISCTPPAGYSLPADAVPAWFFRPGPPGDGADSSNTNAELESTGLEGDALKKEEEKKKKAGKFTRIDRASGNFSLVLRDAHTAHVGYYTVKTTLKKADGGELPNQSAEIRFEARPYIEPYMEISHKVDVEKGINLTCLNKGSQLLSDTVIYWKRNNENFTGEGDRIKLLPSGDLDNKTAQYEPNGTLSFTKTFYEDRAEYTCVAVNSAGNGSSKTLLRVQNPNKFLGPMIALFICMVLTGVLVYAEVWWREKHPVQSQESNVSVTAEGTTLLGKKIPPQSLLIPMVGEGLEVHSLAVVDAAIKWRTFVEKKKALRAGKPLDLPNVKKK